MDLDWEEVESTERSDKDSFDHSLSTTFKEKKKSPNSNFAFILGSFEAAMHIVHIFF